MFTIEHEFDATVITLIDPRTDQPITITLSLSQLRDLSMALDLPEGSYRLRKEDKTS